VWAIALALTIALFAGPLSASPIASPAEPPGEPGQVFVLQDYRWVPVIVKRTPTAIDCHFDVVNGSPTVHAELVSENDFLLFSRHRDYDTLAMTQTAASGGFQRMIEAPGRYRVLVRNDAAAPPVAVSLIVRTDVDPPPDMYSTGVSPRRKAVVIATSLMVFFGTVLWSGRKLLFAWRSRRDEYLNWKEPHGLG
jgi:hypothetical protein